MNRRSTSFSSLTGAFVRAAAIFGFVLLSSAFASGSVGGLIPVHGYVLGVPQHGQLLMRLEPVVNMLKGGTYHVGDDAPGKPPAPGTEVDALLVREPRGLVLRGQPTPAVAFVAGTPNTVVTHLVGTGDPAPAFPLVDQLGRPMRLNQFTGKVTLLTFVFSRCPDVTICPAISGKFLYLQHHLDPRRFHLVEVTLDPTYDSPAVLAAYGRQFDADPQMWSLASGESAQVKNVIDSFGVSSLANGESDYIHDVRLEILDANGILRDVSTTADWNPDDVAARARDIAGLPSNPLRTFWFATVANLTAFCGGNASVSGTLLLVVVIVLIGSVTIPLLVWFGRRIHEA
jgi:cytochrome oxidase Cu insertion factor (SCO1/SenC/PrrC family)